MTQQTPNTVPLTHFRVAVSQRLQKAPYPWQGAAGYQLQQRYNDLVQECWEDGGTVDDAAAGVHKLQMSRSQRVYEPTRASLGRAGCRFDDLEKEVAERESDEWEGLADAPY